MGIPTPTSAGASTLRWVLPENTTGVTESRPAQSCGEPWTEGEVEQQVPGVGGMAHPGIGLLIFVAEATLRVETESR